MEIGLRFGRRAQMYFFHVEVSGRRAGEHISPERENSSGGFTSEEAQEETQEETQEEVRPRRDTNAGALQQVEGGELSMHLHLLCSRSHG